MSVTESAPHQKATCRGCDELLLAEAVAKGEQDHSRATDCRVLLKRHQKSSECGAGEQG
ncbi:hypothetical protein [Streptomyces albidoflavus]|uniref:hypothetical protein n=1 Tax=Streptomyces albidoflavus TaxID=1886 RepID=UPI0013EEBB74|nr:hypothetical protein [Streptomyces albidoflavus]WSU19601.1 hypothetical protein OG330_30990 [Streptomyces albidoflavus]WTC33761.1 hypothetical protein OH749_31110 [Streptomyces albidoflavus]CAI4198572.1 hypothetical protein CCOS2040_31195 [Streptomyces albidoflavus]